MADTKHTPTPWRRTLTLNTCRFCKESSFDPSDFVKYGVRHYAHHECYLGAGKSLEDLWAWQIAQFPYRALKKHNLLNEAERLIAAEKARDDALAKAKVTA